MTERLATHLSPVLTSFDALRDAGELLLPANDDALFAKVASDSRASATEPAGQRASTFTLCGSEPGGT